ncbi:hypothetical protein KHQ81_00850 [Mycoplasmatota bacterium]|nr:hypothetical protein KHQ81_00850 [Mycoplasmatota bacterium]
MKKVVYFIVIMVFSIYLFVCKNKDEFNKIPECTNGSVEDGCLMVTTSNQLEDKDRHLTVTPGVQLEVKDLSDEYSIDANTLTTYTNSNDINRYVNIEEFIQFFEGAIHPLSVEKDKDLTLSLEVETENEIGENEKYNARIVFDSDDETIYFSDFHYSEYLNVDAETDFGEGLVVIDYITESKSLEKTMDLKPYGINIVEKDNKYYIPLYLANLLLTGDSAHIYDVNYTLYLFDNFSDAMFTEDLTTYQKVKATNKLFSNSKNFLALLFDYYYGLKDYKQVDSYIKEFNDYELEEQDNFLDYYNELTEFLVDNDDLHTWLISTGYNLDMESYTPDLSNLKKSSNIYRNAISSYVSHQCSLQTEEITYEEIDGVMYIKINAFSEQTDELLKPVMEIASQYDDIVFDVKCNGGGMVSGVIHLLSYMTDEPIDIHYRDEVLDINNNLIFETTESNYMDKNYYVVTSPVTFSAANLFVSIVKENELGVVIGEPSLGGACAIKMVVLPDGSIIQMSGPIGFTNSDYETIENGVTVDFELIPSDYDETYERRAAFFATSKDINSSIDYQNFDDEMTMDDLVFS